MYVLEKVLMEGLFSLDATGPTSYLTDKSARTKELHERIRRQALDPVSHGGGILEHPQEDILGQVDKSREEANYLKKQREGLATAFNAFMVCDSFYCIHDASDCKYSACEADNLSRQTRCP